MNKILFLESIMLKKRYNEEKHKQCIGFHPPVFRRDI